MKASDHLATSRFMYVRLDNGTNRMFSLTYKLGAPADEIQLPDLLAPFGFITVAEPYVERVRQEYPDAVVKAFYGGECE